MKTRPILVFLKQFPMFKLNVEGKDGDFSNANLTFEKIHPV